MSSGAMKIQYEYFHSMLFWQLSINMTIYNIFSTKWYVINNILETINVNSTFTQRRSACEIEWPYSGTTDFRSTSGDCRRGNRSAIFESDFFSGNLPRYLSSSSRATIWVERSLIQGKMRSRIIRRSRITDEQRSRPSNIISVFEYKTWRADVPVKREERKNK